MDFKDYHGWCIVVLIRADLVFNHSNQRSSLHDFSHAFIPFTICIAVAW